jgi:hypothetical protein
MEVDMRLQIIRLELRNSVVPPEHALCQTMNWRAPVCGFMILEVRISQTGDVSDLRVHATLDAQMACW